MFTQQKEKLGQAQPVLFITETMEYGTIEVDQHRPTQDTQAEHRVAFFSQTCKTVQKP